MEDRRGPEPLAEVLSRLFTARGWGRRQARTQLESAWREAVAAAGDLAVSRSQPGALRRGVLEVVVEDAVLLQELAGFHKRRLVSVLEARLGPGQVRDVRFRLGRVSS